MYQKSFDWAISNEKFQISLIQPIIKIKRTVVLIHLFDLANCEDIYTLLHQSYSSPVTLLYQSCLLHYAYHLSYQWDAFSSPSSSTNIWLLCGLYTSLWGSHGGIPSPPSDLLQIICSNAVVLSSGENLPPTLSDY